MSYIPQTWVNEEAGGTPLSAARLNYMETGIASTSALKPTVALAETFSRVASGVTNQPATLSTGRMSLVAAYIPTGTTVTSISFMAASTAAGTPTNQWFALYDSSLNLLRQTVDDTTTAWAVNSFKTLALTSTFATTYSGLHYLAVMVAATTVPTLAGVGGTSPSTQANGLAPITSGSSTTGLTTTAPASAAALTALNNTPYAYIS